MSSPSDNQQLTNFANNVLHEFDDLTTEINDTFNILADVEAQTTKRNTKLREKLKWAQSRILEQESQIQKLTNEINVLKECLREKFDNN